MSTPRRARGTSKKLGICPPDIDFTSRREFATAEHARAAAKEMFGYDVCKNPPDILPSDLDMKVRMPLPKDQATNYKITDAIVKAATPPVNGAIEDAYADLGVYVEMVGWGFYDLSADTVTADMLAGEGLLKMFGFTLAGCTALLK